MTEKYVIIYLFDVLIDVINTMNTLYDVIHSKYSEQDKGMYISSRKPIIEMGCTMVSGTNGKGCCSRH